ncbi:hypothetical protein HK405_013100 [Cladochytrium tenue]|nr:hypothetical protein HK405_013100 [Cladochytrium tenue]
MQSILGTFFATGAEKELNVPSKISKQLLAVAGDGGAGDLRPAVFDAAVENVCTMLRLSSFPSFCKSVGSSPMPAAPISPVSIDGMFGAPSTVSLVRRISTASSISRRKNSASGVFLLRQVLADELPSPYSFKEFYEFLRKEHSEENADFYLKAKKYSEVAKKVPEKFLLPRPAGEQVDAATPAAQPSGDAIGEEAPPPELAELVELMDAIVQAHFTDDSEQELNITHKLRAAFLHSVRDERDLRPAVLDPILDHVTVVMEYSSFPNFRKSVARAEAGVIAASTAVGNKAAGVPSTPTSAGPVAPPAAGRPGALSGLTVAFEESRRGSGDTPSVGEVTPTPSLGLTDQPQATATRKQITIQQILEDQLDSPYTYKEFYDFLCNEHSEENVEFYNTYQSYKVLAAGLPAAVLRPQSAFDALPDGCDRALARSLRSMLERVLRDFFTQGAEFELNVPAKVVRRLLEDVAPLDDQPDDVELEDVVRRCYDPCVFDGAVEAVLTMMRLSSLPSFLKYAKTAKPPSASE